MDRAEAIRKIAYGLEMETSEPTSFGQLTVVRTDALKVALAALREHEERQWVSVNERLPEVEKRVLVCVARHSQYTNKDYTLVTCAIYEDGKVDVEDSCWMCEWGDYDEEADVIHVPEGWYEYHEYGNTEEDGIAFIGDSGYLSEKVTHWMPLPMPPKEGAE